MSDYEFEEAKKDKKGVVTGIAVGLLSLGWALISNGKNNQKESIKTRIEVKKSEYNRLNSKWFKNEEDKERMRELEEEIGELQNQL